MANSQFINKLQRELKRSPKKTAFLALGLLVAGYFWAPLLVGWFGGEDTKPNKEKPVAQAPPVPESRAVAEAGPASTSQVAEFDWEVALVKIQEDPYMISSQIEAQGRSPFDSIPEEIASQLDLPTEPTDEETETQVASVELTTPQSAGLELTSTVVAGNGGWARISGKSYQQGANIYVGEVDRNDPQALATVVSFTLEEIHPTYIVLSREEETYRLEMAVPSLRGGGLIELADTEVTSD